MRAPERGQAAVHVDLGQAVLLTLAAVPAPQTWVTHGQGQRVAAGPPAVHREVVHPLTEPEGHSTASNPQLTSHLFDFCTSTCVSSILRLFGRYGYCVVSKGGRWRAAATLLGLFLQA